MSTTISSTEDFEGVTITLKISRGDLFWISENQQQMLSLLGTDKPLVDQVRFIFILVLEILSRKDRK